VPEQVEAAEIEFEAKGKVLEPGAMLVRRDMWQ